jgi:type II restriction enzyme
LNELTTGNSPDKAKEMARVRKVCNKGTVNKLKTVKVDLSVKGNDGSINLFDLKTVKPNLSNFKDFKRILLEWVAIYFPDADVNSYIAIPYNPYEPKPYEIWALNVRKL